MKVFYRFAERVYSITEKRRKGNLFRKQTAYDIRTLYTERNLEENLKTYYIKKLEIMFCMLGAGIVLAMLLLLKEGLEKNIIDGEYIVRNAYGGGEIMADLEAVYEDGEREEVTLAIQERHFSSEELNGLYEQALNTLQNVMYAEGDSADKVRQNMKFPAQLQGFPFNLRWESEDYEIVDYDGTVYNQEVSQQGKVVKLTVGFYYFDYRRDYIFSVCVLPPIYTQQEIRQRELSDKLTESEKNTIQEEKYVLPKEAGGERIYWKEVRQSRAGIIFLFICAAAVLVYCMKDYDLHRQAQEKQEDMLAAYPEIVNRMVLYVGAGMTVRNAWSKIAVDYSRKADKMKPHYKGSKRGHVYREMLFACHEMDSGVSEAEAYEKFGKRCGVQQYIKLSTLLIQNLQKGNSTMLTQLKEEAELAFEQKISRARKKGEEAGTKLLAPMMMMFGIVMVLIVIPAFGTFGIY